MPPQIAKQVFVAYPYNFPRKEYRRVFEGVGREFGVVFVFADERITNRHVLSKISSLIQISDFSLFDISGWNPNVALELGMAYAWRKDFYILYNPALNAKGEVPSNLGGIDRIQYADYAKLEERLIVLLQQRYPDASPYDNLEDFSAEMQERVLNFVTQKPALNIVEISRSLGLNKSMAQLIVAQLKDKGELQQKGRARAARYFPAKPLSAKQRKH